MKNRTHIFSLAVIAVCMALVPRTMFGLGGGCVDSPEDPTFYMALLGGGAAAASLMWSRMRARGRRR
jgi:XrtJ-associated TM-motif-TM protein